MILQNGSLEDVIEIDAASNSGVDEIREFVISQPMPQVVRLTRSYIIDEVHMLSTGAFNALSNFGRNQLKILFLFWRPLGIRFLQPSRVQRFELNRSSRSY